MESIKENIGEGGKEGTNDVNDEETFKDDKTGDDVTKADTNLNTNDISQPTPLLIEKQNNTVDLLLINYLGSILKVKGLEHFRDLFKALREQEIGPYVYVYCAMVEYFITKNKIISFNIFNTGLKKHQGNTVLEEEFFLFFLKIGDEENARALFKRLNKSDRMWNEMVDYEYRYGSMENYRSCINSYVEGNVERKNVKGEQEVLDGSELLYRKYVKCFEFMGLKIADNSIFEEFIGRICDIKKEENIFGNVNLEDLIEILSKVEL
jgi:cleavage stimulation factor subunit 3